MKQCESSHLQTPLHMKASYPSGATIQSFQPTLSKSTNMLCLLHLDLRWLWPLRWRWRRRLWAWPLGPGEAERLERDCLKKKKNSEERLRIIGTSKIL